MIRRHPPRLSLRHRLAHWLLGWEYVRVERSSAHILDPTTHTVVRAVASGNEATWSCCVARRAQHHEDRRWLHTDGSVQHHHDPLVLDFRHWRPLTPGVAAFYNQPKPDCFQ